MSQKGTEWSIKAISSWFLQNFHLRKWDLSCSLNSQNGWTWAVRDEFLINFSLFSVLFLLVSESAPVWAKFVWLKTRKVNKDRFSTVSETIKVGEFKFFSYWMSLRETTTCMIYDEKLNRDCRSRDSVCAILKPSSDTCTVEWERDEKTFNPHTYPDDYDHSLLLSPRMDYLNLLFLFPFSLSSFFFRPRPQLLRK